MALGQKRICQQCAAKFYDLEKDPIVCPKCDAVFDPEASLKPKRGRKKASAVIEEDDAPEIEIAIDDEAIEDLDDDAAEDLDEDLRDEDLDLEDEEEVGSGKKGKVLEDLDDDADDIIADDVSDKE